MERRKFTREFKLEAVRLIKGSRRFVCAGRARPVCASVAATQLGEGFCGRSGTGLSRPRSDEARAGRDRAAQARGDQAEGRTRHPKKSRGLLREGIDVKFSFIAKHRVIWPAGWLCGALGVSRGGFYAWLTRPRSQRSRSDEELSAKVRASFLASDRTYGARRVWHDHAGGWGVVRTASDRAIDAATGS